MARRTETIRSGGFQGGQFVQAAQPTQGNALLDLADSLSVMNRQGSAIVQGAVESHTKQLELTGNQNAESFIAQHAGVDSEGLKVAMDDPNVADLIKNPWTAAAVQKHRGRLFGDELAQKMTEAGVDTADRKAVAAFYAENAPGGDVNKFFAAGMNEQNSRYQSQWVQQGIQQNAAEIAKTKTAAWGREVFTQIGDGAAIPDVFANINGIAGIKPSEKTSLQMEVLEVMANKGDLEFVTAWANQSRGDAPSLAVDGNVAKEVSALIKRAEQVQEANGAEGRYKIAIGVDKWMGETPYTQLTRGNLEAQPGWGDMNADMQRSLYKQMDAEKERRDADARRGQAARVMNTARESAFAKAAEMMRRGEGSLIIDEPLINPETGEVTVITASALRTRSIETTRKAALGDDPMKADPATVVQYLSLMRGNGSVDPLFKNYFSAVSGLMTPDGVTAGDEQYIGHAAQLMKNMDPEVSAEYLTDPKSRAFMSHMNTLDTQFGGTLPADVLARKAVALTYGATSFLRSDSASIKQASAAIQLRDPMKKDGLFSNNKVYPNVSHPKLISEFILERVQEKVSFGISEAQAIKEASVEITQEFAVVNGMPVRMPHRGGLKTDETTPLMSPEEFGVTMTSALGALADLNGDADNTGYELSRFNDTTYIVRRPDDSLAYLTTRQLSDMAAVRNYRDSVKANETAVLDPSADVAAIKDIARAQNGEDAYAQHMMDKWGVAPKTNQQPPAMLGGQ
jgi:hypothetical protein